MKKLLALFSAIALVTCINCAVETTDELSETQEQEVLRVADTHFASVDGTAFDKQLKINEYVNDLAKNKVYSSNLLKKLYLSLSFNHLCPAVPTPVGGSWGVDDQAGNTNTQGAGTACRAGILQTFFTDGKTYKLSHVFDENSPHSVFADQPLVVTPKPTFCLDSSNFAYDTKFCGHGESLSGDFGGEGTQLDFFGHAGLRATPATPMDQTVFYNGFLAPDVLNGALSSDSVKPVNTIGILLDAKRHNGGVALGPNDVITKADVLAMLHAQDLDWLGFKPGMVVFIYTGKGDTWGLDPMYYLSGPGLRVEVVEDLYKPNHIVWHGLDNPFSDQANLMTFDFLSGNDPLDPFPIHTRTLTAGILQSQNLNLKKLAEDKVYLFSVQMSVPQIAKAKGSMITPQVFGSPWQ